jgi:vacuolar-type H+-ATPase subunit I/STV1
VTDERPLSALPSPLARAIAFASILVGGLAGAVIGFALVDIQYSGEADWPRGLGIVLGATVAAGGTAIVAVLVLRALGEWRDINDRRRS